MPTLNNPGDITVQESKNAAKLLVWQENMKSYLKRKQVLEDNMRDLFSVVWGQCSTSMQSSIKQAETYEDKKAIADCAWLLSEIKNVIFKFSSKKQKFLSLVDARIALDRIRQQEKESNSSFLDQFKVVVDSFEHYGGTIGNDRGLLEYLEDTKEPSHPGDIPEQGDGDDVREWFKKYLTYQNKLKKEARDRTLGIMLLRKADEYRYGDLLASLYNNFTRGSNQYPENLARAYNMLNEHKKEEVRTKNKKIKEEDEATTGGLSFFQHGNVIPGVDGQTHDGVKCYYCKMLGHFKNQCPKLKSPTHFNVLQVESRPGDKFGVMFEQCDNIMMGDIPSTWLLLDTQSTVSVFKNADILENIETVENKLTLLTNGGKHVSNMMGELRNFGKNWYSPTSLANILSLAEVRKKFRVTMDTSVEPAIVVHRKNGTKMKFSEYKSGLYYYEVPVAKDCKLKSFVIDYCFVTTVAGNKKMFTRREVEGANRARKLYTLIGRPGHKRFERIIGNNEIKIVM